MFKKVALVSVLSVLYLFNISNVFAGSNYGELDGEYIPKKGWAEMLEIFPGENTGEQLGRYKIVLKRKGWQSLSGSEKERVRLKLVLKGVIHGVLENNSTAPVLEHQIINHSRDGAFFTQNDTVVVTGAVPCSSAGGLLLNVVETLNIDYGTGIYSGVQTGGSLVVLGTVNQCNSQLDFEVIKGQGGICFGDNCN